MKSARVLKELSRDPKLKKMIARARRHTDAKGRAKIESLTGTLLLVLTVVSHFSKKKKARALGELRDALYVLVQVSLLLKENIFDRPEVKKFFSKSSKQIYLLARECLALMLPKAKGDASAHVSRSI